MQKSYSSASTAGLTVEIQYDSTGPIVIGNQNHDAGNCHHTTGWHYLKVKSGIGELKSGHVKSVCIFHIQTRYISNYFAWYIY